VFLFGGLNGDSPDMCPFEQDQAYTGPARTKWKKKTPFYESKLFPIAEELLSVLMERNIKLALHNEAVTTNSLYFKFENPLLGSLTVRDHKGKAKYSYRWNLQKNYTGPRMRKRNGIENFFYGFGEIEQMADDIEAFLKSRTVDIEEDFDIEG